MILPDFKAFPRDGRVMGIDWGMRRIGVAVSDPMRNFVFVRPVLSFSRRSGGHAEKVAEQVKAENVVGVVVGLPVHTDGSDSATTVCVRQFIDDLAKIVSVPVVMLEKWGGLEFVI